MPIEIHARVEGDRELMRALERAPAQILRRVWSVLREVALALVRWVKVAMPVDTGRARASWGQWDGSTDNPQASSEDAVWEEDRGNLTITQGSNVEYIGALNDGHSAQAPKGFIDRLVLRATRLLFRRIDELLRDVL